MVKWTLRGRKGRGPSRGWRLRREGVKVDLQGWQDGELRESLQGLCYLEGFRPYITRGKIRGMCRTSEEVGHRVVQGLEKTQGFKKKTAVFFGFYCFFWVLLGYLGFIMFFFLYYCVFKLFLTRKKKITIQQMFHLDVLLRYLSEYCGCHYACAEQDVRFLTQHVHL